MVTLLNTSTAKMTENVGSAERKYKAATTELDGDDEKTRRYSVVIDGR